MNEQEAREKLREKEFWNLANRKRNDSEILKAMHKKASGITELTAMCAKSLIRLVELQEKGKTKKSKRKPSAWNIFTGEQAKQGKTFKEAAELWKQKH